MMGIMKQWLAMGFSMVFVLGSLRAQGAGETRWWKGNTHTHSLWSDGNDFPEMITDWYRKKGYHFLAISDHNVLQEGEKGQSVQTINKRQRGIGRTAIQKYRARFGDDWIETREVDGVTYYQLKTL
ncbi:MAG: PHP domain-containing protein, partial [Verrucomicrobiales bacterium]